MVDLYHVCIGFTVLVNSDWSWDTTEEFAAPDNLAPKPCIKYRIQIVLSFYCKKKIAVFILVTLDLSWVMVEVASETCDAKPFYNILNMNIIVSSLYSYKYFKYLSCIVVYLLVKFDWNWDNVEAVEATAENWADCSIFY